MMLQSRNSIQVSHVNVRIPRTWAITGCLPRRIHKKLNQKQVSWNSNQYSQRGQGWHERHEKQLTMLPHNVCSRTTTFIISFFFFFKVQLYHKGGWEKKAISNSYMWFHEFLLESRPNKRSLIFFPVYLSKKQFWVNMCGLELNLSVSQRPGC